MARMKTGDEPSRLVFLSSVPLTPAEIRRRRNEDWRIEHDEGRYDPILKRRLRRTLALIATIYNVDAATVMRGIRSARRLNAELSDVASETPG